MDSKKTFWIIAVVVALAGIAAAVAYFVTRYISKCNDEYDELYDCDCGCMDDGCCGCDDGEGTEEAEPAAE